MVERLFLPVKKSSISIKPPKKCKIKYQKKHKKVLVAFLALLFYLKIKLFFTGCSKSALIGGIFGISLFMHQQPKVGKLSRSFRIDMGCLKIC